MILLVDRSIVLAGTIIRSLGIHTVCSPRRGTEDLILIDIVHTYGDAQHRAERDELGTDVAIADGTVVGTPVIHHRIDILETALARQTRCKPRRRPRAVGTVVDHLKDVWIGIHSPALGNLQNGAYPLHEVQAAHRHRHLAAREEVRRVTTTAEVTTIGGEPRRSGQTLILLLLGDLPEGLRGGGLWPQRHRGRFPRPTPMDRLEAQWRLCRGDAQLVVRLERYP